MNRRGLLGGILAALAAPAIIRTPGLLMPVHAPLWAARDPYHFEITTGCVLNVGDVITFDGVEQVQRNWGWPGDGSPMGRERQFVVTGVAKTGAAILSIYPAMTAQTVVMPRRSRPLVPRLVADIHTVTQGLSRDIATYIA